MINIVILCLAATDLILVDLGGWGLTPFWIAFALAVIRFGISFQVSLLTRQAWIGLFALATVVVLSPVWSPRDIRFTSYFLSMGYLSFGFWLLSVMHRVRIHDFEKTLKIILSMYGVSTLLAYGLVRLGAPDSTLSFIAKSTLDVGSETFRIQALSSEPSYAATVVVTCFIGLMRVRSSYVERDDYRKFWGWIILCLAMILFFRSILGYVLAGLVFVTVLRNRRGRAYYIWLVIFGICLIVLADSRYRFFRILTGLGSGDLSVLNETDSSSYMRIGPTGYYLSNVDISNYSFWLGHGAAKSTSFFSSIYGQGVATEVITLVGFVPAFLYDYGVLGAGFFMVFAYWCCGGFYKWLALTLLISTSFNANFNTQLLWFVLTVLAMSNASMARKGAKFH